MRRRGFWGVEKFGSTEASGIGVPSYRRSGIGVPSEFPPTEDRESEFEGESEFPPTEPQITFGLAFFRLR